MLHRASRLEGTLVQGTDGEIGTVERLYFDDQQWTISHLVVHTEKSLDGRSVLVSPSSVRRNWNVAALPTTLSRNDIVNSPEADADSPPPERADAGASHVRNTKDLKGFHIEATDGEIGHVDDVLIDEDSWRIRYLVVDTSNWIGGKWVAVAPSALRGINWAEGKLEVAITREAVKHSPDIDTVGVPSAEMMPPFVLL
jgi:sporulation protein YlmC with PRC-barrel domain